MGKQDSFMFRRARIVVAGLPHHVTIRGIRRDTGLFCDADCQAYLDLMRTALTKSGSLVWAWCLTPSHARPYGRAF